MDKQHVRFILTLIGILAALWAIDPSFTATVVMPVTVTYLRFLSRRRQTQGCYTGGGNPPLVIAPERITMATRVVGDITRVNPGTEGELLKNMLDQLGSNEYQIDILAMPNQAAAMTAHFRELRFHVINALFPDQGVIDWIAAETRSDVQATFVIFTFHARVSRFVKDLASNRISVEGMRRFTASQPMSMPWPEDLMPIDEAVHILVDALSRTRTRSMQKSFVRQALIFEDPRFDRAASPAAATPGLVSTLLEAAWQRGLVTLTGQDPEVVVSVNADSSPKSELSSEVVNADSSPESELSSEVIASEAATEDGGVPAQSKRKTRSQRFIEVLRKDNLGYQKARNAVHDQMEAVIAEGPPITVAELIDTSVDRTQRQFDDPDLHPWAARFNWRGLKASLSRLLQQRPVIIGVDGELIKPDWEGQIQIVNALANNWREELLGEEIIAIAREIKLTPSSDLANLAGALFLNRERKSLERVAEIINHLRSTGRIEVDADGVLRVLAHTPQGARRSLGIVPSVSNTIAQDEEQLA